MRVCQPGPVARHFSITDTGNRIVINLRGSDDTGRPPFLNTARANISSVSSGISSYSKGRMT